jgi:hypothetical protein
MARHETDREDLMAEATALRQRIELKLPGVAEHVVAGFRDNGGCSIYFGADPVFQFDADGALRRAFVGGDLYRTQGKTMARLTRTRAGHEVHLVRHDLVPAELAGFIAAMSGHVDRLYGALSDDSARVVRQVPEEANLRERLAAVLSAARHVQLSEAIRGR